MSRDLIAVRWWKVTVHITTRVFMESTVEQQFDGCIEEDEKQLWGFYLLSGEKETR